MISAIPIRITIISITTIIRDIIPITAIRGMIIIINGETEMIEMRTNDVKIPKIVGIFPVLFIVKALKKPKEIVDPWEVS